MKDIQQKKEQNKDTASFVAPVSSTFGPMTMVKIDGTKVRYFRESQGLTQLYVATAVGVTTDTVSRWENGRYLNIKRENGVRLAKALEISLDDIVLAEKREQKKGKQAEFTVDGEQNGAGGDDLQLQNRLDVFVEKLRRASEFKNRILRFFKFVTICVQQSSFSKVVLGLVVLFSFVALFFIFLFSQTKSSARVTAIRIAPSFALPHQKIPVIIKVNMTQESDTTAVILRESFTEKGTVDRATISPAPAQLPTLHNTEIKWLIQLKSNTYFSYILQVGDYPDEQSTFHGTISSQGESGQKIRGSATLVTGKYHWADENRDEVIDDREMILVYDRFSKVAGFAAEIDATERIWLGRGYRWNEQTKELKIIPLSQ